MTRQIQNILKGCGSIIDIAPKSRFYRFVPKQTASERMKGHWIRVGNNIQSAIGQFQDNQEREKKKL